MTLFNVNIRVKWYMMQNSQTRCGPKWPPKQWSKPLCGFLIDFTAMSLYFIRHYQVGRNKTEIACLLYIDVVVDTSYIKFNSINIE